ncbi:MAG: NAD-dependent succinate-semialdehyde dehydrogenase [Planctomycetes bacterium]|nr:NAD-dependent succinate-semialdehyde dehydrogenase [Planctomycetota bacterium]
MIFSTINPATEEVLDEYETMSGEQVAGAIESAREAYESWRLAAIGERLQCMVKLAVILRANARRFGDIITKEMGKPIKQSIAEVEKSAWCAEFYAEEGAKWLESQPIEADGMLHKVAYEPLGVILSVMPWNFPFWQVYRFAVPTILAGNVSLLKHATNVSRSALVIESTFREAGFPKNVFQTLLADHDTVAEVIRSDLVSGVSLTGSTRAGERVGELAGKNLKKVVLELGGSDPFIVLEDADIELAAKNAVLGRMQNAGQSCIAAKRFIVHKSIADDFIKAFTEKTKAMVIGDPLDEKTEIGPLVNRAALEEIEGQVEDARAKGATICTGGKRLDRKGYFYEPTVIANTTGDMRCVAEEVFGPVAAVIVVESDAEAIEVANSTEFGLGGSVWTRDIERGLKVASGVESGMVFVNSITKSDPRIPFGGIKKSGLGREMSYFGLHEFVNIKSYSVYEHK